MKEGKRKSIKPETKCSCSIPNSNSKTTPPRFHSQKMADSEFEEFKRYFDKLPQYIKAPSHCYTLLPNIDLLDEEPLTPNRCCEEDTPCTLTNYERREDNCAENCDAICEPFSGDLQLVVPECTERENLPTFANKTRKRRKLPEIPKSGRKWNEDSHMSLAQELSEADKGSGNVNRWPLNQRNLVDNTSTYGSERPVFILSTASTLCFCHSSRSCPCRPGHDNDEESSPDSEKYPSLDSGHSTNHSEDGSKPYSPQIPSINESYSPMSPSLTGVPFTHLEILDATHRGLHKFIPRHRDEIEVDIGDPIYMQKEADDLWCEGVNLRTGMQGVFPSAYVVDVEYNDFDPSANKLKKERYLINYIGSVETLYHKGNEVLCQAVKKISGLENYVSSHTRPCILEISDQGIRMVDKGKPEPNRAPCYDYFYALKNVSFCGFHPNDHRYFGFVSKHPTLNRFACHVFISDSTTRPVAEAVGRAFQRFYQKFLETAYPIEDIYLE